MVEQVQNDLEFQSAKQRAEIRHLINLILELAKMTHEPGLSKEVEKVKTYYGIKENGE